MVIHQSPVVAAASRACQAPGAPIWSCGITTALTDIVALFFGGDTFSFVEFGKQVNLPRDLGGALGAASTARPHGLIPLGTPSAVEGLRRTEYGYPFFRGSRRPLVSEALWFCLGSPAGGLPDVAEEAALGCAPVDREVAHGLFGERSDSDGRAPLSHRRNQFGANWLIISLGRRLVIEGHNLRGRVRPNDRYTECCRQLGTC
jgi:hypothetical protein